MNPGDKALLAELRSTAEFAVAIEALWDGDTQGWFVDLYAVIKGNAGYWGRLLRTFSGGGDIRLFNGHVPPWPEAREAARIGRLLAAQLNVPFHFPSPEHPEDECPHWWELADSYPCSRCGIRLFQASDCRWRGACYYCHLALERESKEARWSPEERAAPRCDMCGNPVVGATVERPRCGPCREKYRTYICAGCSKTVTIHRDYWRDDTCSSCMMVQKIAALPPGELDRIREAATRGTIAALIVVEEVLKCELGGVQEALRKLGRLPHDK